MKFQTKPVQYLTMISMVVLLIFSGCRKENLELEEDNADVLTQDAIHDDAYLLQKVIDMGFREDMIENKGDYFLVEGDIKIVKEELAHGDYDFDPNAVDYTDEDCMEGEECIELAGDRQARRSSLVENLVISTITVRVDASIPTTGVDNWRTEVQQAVNDWNTTQSAIRMIFTTASTANITVRADGGSLPDNTIASASWPSGGNPGSTIDVNLDFFSNQNVPTARKRYNMVHELGHCIGFRHTNWSALGESSATQIPGTPTTDGSSVMNGGTALSSWIGFSTWDIAAVQIIYPTRHVNGVGSAGEGASMVIDNIGGSSLPDAIFMAYDAPSGANQFRYFIGYDLDASGIAQSYSSVKNISGVGNAGDGAGIAIGNIGGGSGKDIILMAYDDPSGANQFRYKVGYDINASGNVTSWSSVKNISGVGSAGDGADIAIGNIGGSSLPDIILMAYDDPSGVNQFRYKIGYDINSNGDVAYWSSIKYISGLGDAGEGAGICIGDIGGTSLPDIILMAYDASSGGNQFRYKVGYDLNSSGNASSWSSVKNINGVGNVGDGAGCELWNIGAGTRPELFLLGYDDPSGNNQFRYRVGYDINTNGDATHW